MNTSISEKVSSNPENDVLFSFFKIKKAEVKLYEWEYNGFDEGGNYLLGKMGEKLPQETKYRLSTLNVLVNANTGEIFSLHYGRYTFLLKPDYQKLGYSNSDALRKGCTLDDWIDISQLGEEWMLMQKIDEEDEEQALLDAYELTKGNE
ncbi:MAG: hypothetical protein R3E32_09450 [Chitinophagales bacterium]